MFHRARSKDMEERFGPAGHMRDCPFCGYSDVAICQMNDTFVECLRCNAEGPPIKRKSTDNPEEAAFRAIQLWRGKEPEPKLEFTAKARKAQMRYVEIGMRLCEIMDIVNAEWQSDPQSVQCFDLRLVNEANELLKERQKCSII